MALDLPKFKENKKLYYGLGGAAALYVGYRWWTASQAQAAAPVTGEDYASMAVGGEGAPVQGNVQYGGANPDTGYTAPMTNPEWTANAVQELVYQGWDGATVQAALGRYLTHQTLSSTDETIVRAAIAVAGDPPQGTFTILHETGSSTTTGTSTTGTSGSTTVLAMPTGFRTLNATRTTAQVSWTPVSGADGYQVVYGGGFANQGPGPKVKVPGASFWGLKPGQKYWYRVRAYDSKDFGPLSADQYFLTLK